MITSRRFANVFRHLVGPVKIVYVNNKNRWQFERQVDQFRRQIILMKKYLTVCRVASEEKLLLRLVGRQHFVDGSDLYSVEDLVRTL